MSLKKIMIGFPIFISGFCPVSVEEEVAARCLVRMKNINLCESSPLDPIKDQLKVIFLLSLSLFSYYSRLNKHLSKVFTVQVLEYIKL